jgi:hypothetical protein
MKIIWVSRLQNRMSILSDEPKPEQKVKGKNNFVTWQREFKRAARAKDVLKILDGEEDTIKEPEEKDFVVYAEVRAEGRQTRSQAPITPGADAEDTTARKVDLERSMLRYQIAYRKWEKN